MKKNNLIYINSLLKKNKKAMTLIELIISIAILSIVLTGVFSMQLFGMKSFKKGNTQTDVQYQVRSASDFFVKELRNAAEITFTTPADPDDYKYIYVDSKIIKYKDGAAAPVSKTLDIISNTGDLVFSTKTVNDRNVLSYSIAGNLSGQKYSTSSEILLNNISGIPDTSNKNYIYYKDSSAVAVSPSVSPSVPVPTVPTIVSLVTTLSGTNDKNEFNLSFNKEITGIESPSGEAISISYSVDKKSATITLSSPASVKNNDTVSFTVRDSDNFTVDYTFQFNNGPKTWSQI